MEEKFAESGVVGVLHYPASSPVAALALTHGAGADADAPMLTEMARALTEQGWLMLRYHLPFRLARPSGPPHPAHAAEDRAGIRAALAALRGRYAGPLYCGGHSYGGRQSTMLAAEQSGLADALLLLAYPLHPPRRPAELRTAHFPQLHTPALFVHGTRDPFGSIAEMEAALPLIAAPVDLLPLAPAGHDLKPAPAHAAEIARRVAAIAAACRSDSPGRNASR